MGIVTAGVVGPVGNWLADRRRFTHDSNLKSSDDLLSLIDQVEVALDQLGVACAEMRRQVVLYESDPVRVGPSLQNAQDAYQPARALIARLRMRPHASDDLVERAKTAADHFQKATRLVRKALVIRQLGERATQEARMDGRTALENVPDAVEKGYAATRDYENSARLAVSQLLGTPASSP